MSIVGVILDVFIKIDVSCIIHMKHQTQWGRKKHLWAGVQTGVTLTVINGE